MSVWTFELTERDRTPIAQIKNAHERKVTMALNRPSTASFKLASTSPLVPTLFDRDVLLQVWQDSTLRFWGPIQNVQLSSNEGGEGPSVAVTASDPSVGFAKRFIFSGQTNFIAGDKITIFETALTDVNEQAFPKKVHTGVRTNGATSGTSTTYQYQHFQSLGFLLTDLAASSSGFDWRIEPEAASLTPGVLGFFSAAAVLGSDKPGTVFEYGMGRNNVRNFTFTRDLTNLTNSATYIPDDEWLPVMNFDTKSMEMHGKFEEVVESIGLAAIGLQEAWTKDVVNIKRDPRRILTMTPDFDDSSGRVPIFGTDYYLGDTVRAGVAIENNVIVNGIVRIFQVEASVDDNGQAVMTPTLVEEEQEL